MALSFGDAIKASQNFDFGAYKEPAGFDVDFFSPDQTSSINWADIYANPDVLKGYGDGYSSSFDSLSDKATDYIQQIADKEQENKFLENQKANQIFQQVSPSVTLTRDGVPTGMNPYGSSGTYGNIAAGLSGLQGAFRPAGSAFGISDIAKMGGSALASKALYAVNPVLGAVNQFYPGGIQQGFKDVTRFAGDAFGGIAKGVGGVVKGVGDFFRGLCDERVKVDIAPLESTEVNDELARIAFLVKGLRECA
jgi:hypothetical protein